MLGVTSGVGVGVKKLVNEAVIIHSAPDGVGSA